MPHTKWLVFPEESHGTGNKTTVLLSPKEPVDLGDLICRAVAAPNPAGAPLLSEMRKDTTTRVCRPLETAGRVGARGDARPRITSSIVLELGPARKQMLHLIQRLKELTKPWIFGRTKPEGHNGDVRPDEREVRLLAVTEDVRMWDSLREIADHAHCWRLFRARSCEEAIAALDKDAIRIVIYDRDLPGGNWRGALLRISSSRTPVCVFLASPVADDYLWMEVVRHHGFDILPQPFQAEHVTRAVNLASSWGGWTNRPVTGGHPRSAA